MFLGWTVCHGHQILTFFLFFLEILTFFPQILNTKNAESCTQARRQEREERVEGVLYKMPSDGRGGEGSQGKTSHGATCNYSAFPAPHNIHTVFNRCISWCVVFSTHPLPKGVCSAQTISKTGCMSSSAFGASQYGSSNPLHRSSHGRPRNSGTGPASRGQRELLAPLLPNPSNKVSGGARKDSGSRGERRAFM